MRKQNQKERGQGLLEYALILVAVALGALITLNLFGVSTGELYRTAINAIGLSPSGGSPSEEAALPGDPAAPPEEEGPLFEDDFSEGLGGWTFLASKFWKGTVTEKDGKMMVGPMGAAFATGFSGTDYTITLSGAELQKKASNNEGFNVIFRSDDATTTFDGYTFSIDKPKNKDAGTLYFYKWENGVQMEQPISSAAVPSGFNWDHPGDIQVRVEGSSFTAAINGQTVLTGSDSTYPQGGVGLSSNFGSYLLVDGVSIQGAP